MTTGGKSPRRKGAVGEQKVVAWLRANGYPDARRFLAGDGRQPGDIDGVPGVCLDVKNRKRYELSGWLAELDAQQRPDQLLSFLVVRLPGETDPGEWALVTRLRYLPDIVDGPSS